MLISRVQKTIKKFGMLSPGDRVVVAVSGGPDSVCLLSVLKELASEWDLSLHVAHLDHKFRGEESAAEALFVRGLAERFGMPATIESFDVPSYCRERGLSSQTGAREVRYEFLNRTANETGAQRIALGHTATDQAETLLMRLMRGTGVSGLSGIPPKRDRIIRPLIDATRDEVLEYLREQGLLFVVDSSNLKPVYTRNRVRQVLMPVLKAFNPRIEETLANEADLLRDEDEAMEARLAELVPAIIFREGETIHIRRDAFNALLPALRRRALRTALAMAPEGEAPDLSTAQTEEALGFMSEAQAGRAMDLPGGLSLEREYDEFVLRTKTLPKEFLARLTVPGVTAVPELSLVVGAGVLETTDGGRETTDEGGENYLWQAGFDYDKIALPLFLRSRRDGDRFCPAGMSGKSKKLQDYFTDEKVPRRKRDAVPLLATEQDVIGVVGMRTDERFLPGPETKRTIFVRIRKMK
jgi:tRNA(Ile)-lysidine synthase